MGCFAQLALTRETDGYALSLMSREDEKAPYAIAPATEPVREGLRIPFEGGSVRLRADFDFTCDQVHFSALANGAWQPLGTPHQLVYRLDHFMGCRIGLFMSSTREPGGSARFSGFTYHVEEELV